MPEGSAAPAQQVAEGRLTSGRIAMTRAAESEVMLFERYDAVEPELMFFERCEAVEPERHAAAESELMLS